MYKYRYRLYKENSIVWNDIELKTNRSKTKLSKKESIILYTN